MKARRWGNKSPVWCLMVKKKKKKITYQLDFLFPNVFKEVLCKTGLNHFYPNSNVPLSSLLKPQLSNSNNRPVFKDRCVNWYIIITVNNICTSFFSQTAVLSYHLCKEIKQWVVCIHTVSVLKETMNHIFG